MPQGLSTKDETLREVLGNGRKYSVPRFQRDYSWKENHWRDLWEDITELYGRKESTKQDFHYMGYLVLKNHSEQSLTFELIDGQQRLATLSFLVLAAMKRLRALSDQKGNDERAEELEKNFIGTKEIASLRIDKKITLNRNNKDYYRHATEQQDIPTRAVKRTVQLMSSALKFFAEKFEEYHDGIEIADLIEYTASRMVFTNVYIDNEFSAYRVFETLNARGVKLSSADLLKNYLFSMIDQQEHTPSEVFDDLDEDWAYIGEQIGNEQYTKYLLSEWNSRHKRVRESGLFLAIKQSITDRKKAEEYMQILRNECQLYAALLNAEHEFWKEHKDYVKIRKEIRMLNLFGIRLPVSMLMATYHRFCEQFATVLRWVSVLSVRYNIIGNQNANAQEELYNKISIKISGDCALQDIKTMLLTLYPSDQKFKNDFVEKSMPTQQTNKKARYILARTAEALQTDGRTIDDVEETIEHILPQKPSDEWQKYFGLGWAQCIQRLGNMALVAPTQNRDLAQKPYSEKKEVLAQSPYMLNNNVKEYPEWNPDAVESRQRILAAAAVRCWRID